MVGFLKTLELSDHKYQTDVNLRDENYNGNILFLMKEFVSFGTDCQSMYFMSTRVLKDKINGFHIIQFQLAYIIDKVHPSHKISVKLCYELHHIWWENQDLELQECEDCIKKNKAIILAIIMLVPKITHRDTNSISSRLFPLTLEKVLPSFIG